MSRYLRCCLVTMLMVAACADDPQANIDTTAPLGDIIVGGELNRAPEDVSTQPQDTGQPKPEFPEDFVISFVYRGMIPNENTDKSDLYIVDSRGRNPMAPSVELPLALTTFAIDPNACQLVLEKKADGTPLSTGPCSCNLGCVVDDSLTWIAVTVEKPTQTGFAFQVGKFNQDLEVKMVKGARFENIVDTEFAGGYLYFSQVKYCSDTGCQFLVYRYDLDNIPVPESVFLIPPDDDPDLVDGQATTGGHFTASHDGTTLAFVSPTIRSARLYVWRGSGAVQELDYLCPGGLQNGKCTGSGSAFSDLDPLAVSADGKRVAYFPTTSDGLEFRMYHLDAGDVASIKLMDTTDKDFLLESCQQIDFDPWKFSKVGAVSFTADAKGIYLVASSNCHPATRPFTDIIRIDTVVANSTKFKLTSFDNLTNNPHGDGPDNTIIESAVLSPGGGNVAYIASPMYGEDKETPLSASSANAKKSRELWVISTDGKQRRQITYNSKYSATWLTTMAELP